MAICAEQVKQLAAGCGFELAGITDARPHSDFERFERWRGDRFAGEMSYLTDRRGDLRSDPRHLLPAAQSILCVGKLYNTRHPHTEGAGDQGWISRYAWGADYHRVVRDSLETLITQIRQLHGEEFESRICVDTAPLLERSYARQAGLGWIGRNTCLINQQQGSWFFLGELLLSIPLASDEPPPDRCGTCRRCIDACPTQALVPDPDGSWRLDARRCIAYLTIEHRGAQEETELAAATGNHVFGCDICQDVCPWNHRAPEQTDERFQPLLIDRDLDHLGGLTPQEFRHLFRDSPVSRAKYEGFLRNVAVAMGNSAHEKLLEPLDRLRQHPHPVVRRTSGLAYASLLEKLSAGKLTTA